MTIYQYQFFYQYHYFKNFMILLNSCFIFKKIFSWNKVIITTSNHFSQETGRKIPKLDDYSAAYKILDNQADPHAKPLVFIEGGFTRLGAADSTLVNIKNRKIFCYEQINHFDKTRYYPQNTFEIMIEDLNNVVESIGLNKFTLMGNCVGGRLAIQYACKYPQKIQNLITYESAIGELNYPPFEFLMKKFWEINSATQDNFEDLMDQIMKEKLDHNWDFPNYIIRLMINAFKTFDEQGKLRWKFNFQVYSKYYLSHMKFMSLENKFYGPTLLTYGSVSTCPMNPENFKIKFPNLNQKTDIVSFKDYHHASIIFDEKAFTQYANFITNYLNEYDRKNRTK